MRIIFLPVVWLAKIINSFCNYLPEDEDPSEGIPQGTPFGNLPENYRCPLCNAGKEYVRPLF
ncbi:MAG: rubredoxin [Prolixibacteraceae bacterium]|nr:rubredoxin [Prolixibacteraceae bacterium]